MSLRITTIAVVFALVLYLTARKARETLSLGAVNALAEGKSGGIIWENCPPGK